ncbi:MAG TPA: hypothetical protein IAD23_07685 [Candidatus Scubalenecus merdavium]|uniref:DUF5348 domain-containing protein n=1 Tax=Candidatus Scybalenecus merdavium TaxID=2840939 RepID=A0A9D1MVR2_9FIRM|nr:hypothetical protein [Candidatus Scubalenecus merdavium]
MQFEANVMFNGARFDFRLEDGTLLHKSEWNGECYHFKLPDGRERVCKPVYAEVGDDIEIVDFDVRDW